MLRILHYQLILIVVCAVTAHATNAVYVASAAAGANDGTSCANAKASSYFNSSGNWSATPTGIQIGPDTTVHLCGTITGGTNANLLQFQGSGTSGHVITLLFETGAIVQASYCGTAGCIDMNAKSHLLIDGGTTCGEIALVKVACNGIVRSTLAGDPGKTCPAGTCTQQFITDSSAIGSGTQNGSSFSDIEIRNLNIGPTYIRDKTLTTKNGIATTGVEILHDIVTQLKVHHNIFISTEKHVLIGFPDGLTTTYNDFEVYNNSMSDQCWAFGIGENSSGVNGSNITGILFHDNEVSNWDNWAIAGTTTDNDCHTNGTMFFNFHGSTNGRIGDSTSMSYNNYLHGDLTGGYLGSSPSGFLSCQEGCINQQVFNNVIVDTCTGLSPTRTCGTPIYFINPDNGGQTVYNNTIIGSGGGTCIALEATAGQVTVKNNICSGEVNFIYILPNTMSTALVSDNNNAYGVTRWICANTEAGPPSCLNTLAAARANTPAFDTNGSNANPQLAPNFRLLSSSASIALGANLTSLGLSALNNDLDGTSRQTAGPWEAGAYSYFGIAHAPAMFARMKDSN